MCGEMKESVAQAGKKFNWLIRRTDSDSAECILVIDLVLPKSDFPLHDLLDIPSEDGVWAKEEEKEVAEL